MHAVAFVDDRVRLSHLVFWNTIATFLTLGLYRFWARTRLRRHFWGRVVVAGSPGEYMGRGIELMLGFFIIFGALAIVFFAFFLGGLFTFAFAEDVVPTEVLSAVPLILALILLPAALFRARRYRLSRTVWRGIRLGQDGSTLGYMAVWHFGFVLTILTLGLAYPWRSVMTERFRLTHTMVGDQRVGFDGRGSALFAAWLPAWFSGLLLGVCLGALLVWWRLYLRFSEPLSSSNIRPLAAPWSDFYAVPPSLWGLVIFATGALFFFAFVQYRVREFRYFTSRVSVGDARFESALNARDIVGILTPYVLGMIGYLILSFFMVAIIVQMFRDLPVQWSAGPDSFALAVGLIATSLGLLFAASYGVSLLYNLTLRSRLLAAVTGSLTLHNPAALDRIGQTARAGPAFGEGLADALDLGDF